MTTTEYRGFTLSKHTEISTGLGRHRSRRTVWEVCGGPSILGVRGVRSDLRSMRDRIDKALKAEVEAEPGPVDYAITRDGNRIALYRIDRPGRMPVYRVWRRYEGEHQDVETDWQTEAIGRSVFEHAVLACGGRI